MPNLNTCCFFKSVKTGSYVCGIYTLILYTILFIVGSCHAATVKESSLLGLCVMMVVLNASCGICSVIMIVGLYRDSRLMLLPWLVSISMTTLIDVMVTFYLIKDAVKDPFLAVLFVIDVLITALNVYALLCVLSQYSEYKTGNPAEQTLQVRSQIQVHKPTKKTHVTSSVTDATSSNALLLQASTSPKRGSITGASPTGPGKAVVCELTTIAEEKPLSGSKPTLSPEANSLEAQPSTARNENETET